MKKQNKKSRSVKKIIIATAMSIALLAPNTTAFAMPIVRVKNNGNYSKGNLNIKSGDIIVSAGNVNISKTVTSSTNNTTYKPETSVPSTGDIATTGTEYQYAIPIEFRSKSGKAYDLNDCSITLALNASGIDGKPLNKEQLIAAKEIEKQVQTQIFKYPNDWNSTGSYIFNMTLTIKDCINGIQLNPQAILHYKLNNKMLETKVDLGKIKLVNKYNADISVKPKINGNNLALGLDVHKDTGLIDKYDKLNLGYIGENHQIKEVTFNVNPPSGVTLTPIKVEGFNKNSNGSYTLEGKALEDALNGNINLFKIGYENKVVDGNINVNLVNQSIGTIFNNGNKVKSGTNLNFYNGSVAVQFIPKSNNRASDKFNIYSQDERTTTPGMEGMSNAVKTNFNINIKSASGSGTAYVGSSIINGEAIVNLNNKNMKIKGMTYVQLPKAVLNEITEGTVTEKAEVFKEIIDGKYSNENSKNFKPNFVFTKGEFESGKPTTVGGSYWKIPMNLMNWNHVIYGSPVSASVTIAELQYNNIKGVKKAFLQTDSTSDGLTKIKDKLIGIISPTTSVINNTLNSCGYSQSVWSNVFRDGSFSHGVSASDLETWCISNTRFDHFQKGLEDTENYRGRGLDLSNKVIYRDIGWLNQPHTINGAVAVNLPLVNNVFAPNTYIRVDFGSLAAVTGNILVNGKKVLNSNIRVFDNHVIIKIPSNTSVNIIKIIVPVQYTDMSAKDITAEIYPCTENGSFTRGVNTISRVNGQQTRVDEIAQANNTASSTQVKLLQNTENYCNHYSNGINSDNKTTLTDIVNNLNGIATTYTIAGMIPVIDNNSLPAQSGNIDNGDLKTKLISLDTNGAPTWVLPRNKLNAENKKILYSTNAKLLATYTNAKLKEMGWIKYTKGMNLNNMVGYVVRPNIQAGKTYAMHYTIQLTNVNLSKFQTASSQFKYYDVNNKVGTTSPVVTVYPSGSSEGRDWVSSVVVQTYGKNSSGQTIVTNTSTVPEAILNKGLVGPKNSINKIWTINDIFNNGPDINPKYPSLLTPKKLMNIVKFATSNKSDLEKMGYKLDYVTVNGVNVAVGENGKYSMDNQKLINWFENVGISTNTTLTHVKFILSKIAKVPVTVQVKVLNDKGILMPLDVENIPLHKVEEAYPTISLNKKLCEIKIPIGYKLIKETVNGEKINPEANGENLPSEVSNTGDHIIYYLEKIPTTIEIKVEYPNGEIVSNSQQKVIGEPEANSNLNNVIIPKGYRVESTTITDLNNNKIISKTDGKINIVSKFKNYNTSIVIKLVKKVKGSVTVKLEDINGKILSSKETMGYVSEKDTSLKPIIPKGYHLVKVITDTGKVIKTDNSSKMEQYIPTVYEKGNKTITYIIEKDIYPNGVDIGKDVKKANSKKSAKKKEVIQKDTLPPIKKEVNVKNKEQKKKVEINIKSEVPKKKEEKDNKTIIINKNNKVLTEKNTIKKDKVLAKKSIIKKDKVLAEKSVIKKDSAIAEKNPKTGDSSNIPYEIGLFLGLLTLIIINLKKKK